MQLLEACDAMHSAGILHRDLKPENVLVSESGDLVVNDFDSACFTSSSESVRKQLAGTEAFRQDTLKFIFLIPEMYSLLLLQRKIWLET